MTKQLRNDSIIDFDKEVIAIEEILGIMWEPISDIREIVSLIRDQSKKDVLSQFTPYDISQKAIELYELRVELLKQVVPKEELILAKSYDAGCHFLLEISTSGPRLITDALDELGITHNFEDNAKTLYSKIKSLYPKYSLAKPKGWALLRKNYSDYDGMEEYDPEPDYDKFRGFDTRGNSASHFTYRIATPYIMYDNICQGRPRALALVNAIYSHFLCLYHHQHKLELSSALDALGLHTDNKLLFDLNKESDNKLVQILIKIAKQPFSSIDYAEAIKRSKDFKSLPLEEQERIKKENQRKILESVVSRLAGPVAKDDGKDVKIENVKLLLQEEFGF